jgi:hypothetical protein
MMPPRLPSRSAARSLALHFYHDPPVPLFPQRAGFFVRRCSCERPREDGGDHDDGRRIGENVDHAALLILST